MARFTYEDLDNGDTSKLSISDQMSLDYGGGLSDEGRQFISDSMSVGLGVGGLSPDARTLISNEISRGLGTGGITPLPRDSIYVDNS